MNEKKKEELRAKLVAFMQQYRRKKRQGSGEPNDRNYDRELERRVKRMKVEDLDELLNE
jgi:hypothetical protein